MTKTIAAGPTDAAPALARSLKRRHVTMISLGGVIGAGLFVGSSAAIASIGPAVIVSYALAGLIVLIVMQVIAGLAVAVPHAGAFTEYARAGIGRWAGFTSGWLYWYFWAIVIGIEAIAGAAIIAQWVALPLWLIGTAVMLLLTGTNLLSTRSFGEFEFWFSTIKVVAIGLFIIACAAFIFGPGPGVANLTQAGGFAPNGWGAVLAGVTSVLFALVGAEIVTVAAAEAEDSATLVARMASTLILRLSLFYIGAIFLILCIVPWNQVVPGQSPFAAALTVVGIPGAALVMNLVVLVAVLSCLNSAIYVASRALFTLAANGDAPRWMVAIDRRGVPARSILACTAVGFACVLASELSPSGVFAFLVNASGAIIIFVYMLTVLAAIRLGVGTGPLLRWGRHGALAAMLAVLVAMARTPDLAIQLYASLGCLAVVLLAACLSRRPVS
ncbi:amino acid permease [Sandarakinorhabdus rubra]|uniref:amino acid permease n=1 Tax=Sandarakinorhabdus rubra TaxID=2672568 RepID=UPI0013DA6727|nr:amino acid permease [Sandarakinorhabdus rubra]